MPERLDPRTRAEPTRRVAVVACMDARLDPASALGLSLGEAHVLRNAGGVVTDDVLRSLVVSQRVLGTEEVVVLHHTGCGMADLDGAAIAGALEREAGEPPPFDLAPIGDAASSVRAAAARLAESPWLRCARIRGLVYDVETSRVEVVDLS